MSASGVSCREVLDFLAAYLDGELAAGVRAGFEAHLARCPACVSYLEGYRETIRLGRDAYAPDAPLAEDVPEELVEAILAVTRSA